MAQRDHSAELHDQFLAACTTHEAVGCGQPTTRTRRLECLIGRHFKPHSLLQHRFSVDVEEVGHQEAVGLTAQEHALAIGTLRQRRYVIGPREPADCRGSDQVTQAS